MGLSQLGPVLCRQLEVTIFRPPKSHAQLIVTARSHHLHRKPTVTSLHVHGLALVGEVERCRRALVSTVGAEAECAVGTLCLSHTIVRILVLVVASTGVTLLGKRIHARTRLRPLTALYHLACLSRADLPLLYPSLYSTY